MGRSKSGWKNIIRRMEVFLCGPLGFKIDNNMKNMLMVRAFFFMDIIPPYLLHPVIAGISEDCR
jgi:hypothetical protein